MRSVIVKDAKESKAIQEKPSIESVVNGSFLVKNLKDFRNSKGEAIEVKPVMSLCRCGRSSNHPFCDGTHLQIGFRSDKAPDRVPDRLDTYVGKGITIHDNSGVCSHAGYCTKYSPAVFNDNKEPWIDPDAAAPEETAKTIRMCPSGALSYTKDGVLCKDLDRKPSMTISKNGPYCVVGGIELRDPGGSKPESKEHYVLCRCGASKNKPFCDGAHSEANFQDDKN
jgi:CDGSH-type Zn-finger protein